MGKGDGHVIPKKKTNLCVFAGEQLPSLVVHLLTYNPSMHLSIHPPISPTNVIIYCWNFRLPRQRAQ